MITLQDMEMKSFIFPLVINIDINNNTISSDEYSNILCTMLMDL